MKVFLGFTIFIVVLGLMVCFVGWVFATDFIIFDILLMLAPTAIGIFVVLLILKGIIWLINELI